MDPLELEKIYGPGALEHYDRDGERINMWQWAYLSKQYDYKVLKKTRCPNGREVSTVWLGFDHGWSKDGPPIIFETMIFSWEGDPANQDCQRYATEAEALGGHEAWVRKYGKGRRMKKRVLKKKIARERERHRQFSRRLRNTGWRLFWSAPYLSPVPPRRRRRG